MSGKKKGGCLKLFMITGVVVTTIILCVLAVMGGIRIKEALSETAIQVPFENGVEETEEVKSGFYYSQLEESDKKVYREIYKGLTEQKENIYVHCGDREAIQKIYEFVMNDTPEIFWSDGSGEIRQYAIEDEEYVDGEKELKSYGMLKPHYQYTGDEKQKMEAKIKEEAVKCLNGIDGQASDYEKIKYVYEYIVNTVDYDIDAADSQNIYSVFGNKKSVCAGYAKASQYLLNRLGVSCIYITGRSKGELHAWNIVTCEGEYYGYDATWGDPVFTKENGEQVEDLDNIIYDYLCCDDREMEKTHAAEQKYGITYPECTSMKYNYYVQNNMYYDKYNKEEIRKALYRSIDKKEAWVTVKFSSTKLYEKARNEVMKSLLDSAQQHLMQKYGLRRTETTYQDNKDLNKITFYWEYK